MHLIPKLLMAKSKKIWEERNQRSCIIVDLASCTSDVSTVALTLKDVIHKVRMSCVVYGTYVHITILVQSAHTHVCVCNHTYLHT